MNGFEFFAVIETVGFEQLFPVCRRRPSPGCGAFSQRSGRIDIIFAVVGMLLAKSILAFNVRAIIVKDL